MAQPSSSEPGLQLGHEPRQLPPAEEIRARRRALGLTQSELAEELGVRSNTVARWERGELRPIHLDQLSRVLARLEQSRTPPLFHDARPRRLHALAGGLRQVELPMQLSTFVGREKDVVELKRLIAQARLVTITGTGGIGKTRLALRIAAELSDAYSEGVWFVDLAPVADAALVGRSVAAALGVREKVGHSLIDTLGDALRDREVLLVLDNCEHLVQACAELAHALLSRCPRVHILATSREALGVPGEVGSQLMPLELPTDGVWQNQQQRPQSEAERLFEQRALAALPSFTVTERNATAVADVCRRLDGIPLALELAAALVPVLAVDQIAARLDDRFGLLSTTNRLAPPRHQTLRAAVEWSHELLSEAERRLFNRLSIFSGGLTLEAAESLGAEETGPSSNVVTLLGRLVGKSLVVAEIRSGGQVRYRLLETLRQYGENRLTESGDVRTARRRHAAYYLALAESAEHELRGRQQGAWLDRLEADYDNLRSALRWYLQEGEVEQAQRVGGALWQFWWLRGYLEEGWTWMMRILQLPGTDASNRMRAKVLFGASMLTYYRDDRRASMSLSEEALALSRAVGEQVQVAWLLTHLGKLTRMEYGYARSRQLLEESMQVARAAGARIEEAEGLLNLARLEFLEGELDRAQPKLEQALALCEAVGYGHGTIQALRFLGEVAFQRADYTLARSYIEASRERGRELGDPWRTAWASVPLGYVYLAQGQHEQARAIWTETLLAWRDLGNVNQFAGTLEGLAYLLAHRRRLKDAMRLASAAAAVRRAKDSLTLPEAGLWLGRWLPAARSKLGEDEASAAWSVGQSMSVDDAVAYALSAVASAIKGDRRRALSSTMGGLTARELEVVELITDGATDHTIADALVISERTAHAHVRNILDKLGLQSRVQIAAWSVHNKLDER